MLGLSLAYLLVHYLECAGISLSLCSNDQLGVLIVPFTRRAKNRIVRSQWLANALEWVSFGTVLQGPLHLWGTSIEPKANTLCPVCASLSSFSFLYAS